VGKRELRFFEQQFVVFVSSSWVWRVIRLVKARDEVLIKRPNLHERKDERENQLDKSVESSDRARPVDESVHSSLSHSFVGAHLKPDYVIHVYGVGRCRIPFDAGEGMVRWFAEEIAVVGDDFCYLDVIIEDLRNSSLEWY